MYCFQIAENVPGYLPECLPEVHVCDTVEEMRDTIDDARLRFCGELPGGRISFIPPYAFEIPDASMFSWFAAECDNTGRVLHVIGMTQEEALACED